MLPVYFTVLTAYLVHVIIPAVDTVWRNMMKIYMPRFINSIIAKLVL
jgi:hypothetical protein